MLKRWRTVCNIATNLIGTEFELPIYCIQGKRVKGLFIKDSAVKGGLSGVDILRIKGEKVFQMWTSALFGAKNSDFSKFLV